MENTTVNLNDVVSKIIAYEGGEMDQDETVQFFSEIIKAGLLFTLQGHYARMASQLVRAGLIDPLGNIL